MRRSSSAMSPDRVAGRLWLRTGVPGPRCVLPRTKRGSSECAPRCPLFVPSASAPKASLCLLTSLAIRLSREVREIFRRHTDQIEPLSLDDAYLDVSENKTGLPSTRVAHAIRQQIREELHLTASAGSPSKFLAKIASDLRKPDGLFVIRPKDVESFLGPLAVGRIPSVGKVTESRLKEMNVSTVVDFAGRTLEELESRFGRYGLRLYDRAPINSTGPPQSKSASGSNEPAIPSIMYRAEPSLLPNDKRHCRCETEARFPARSSATL